MSAPVRSLTAGLSPDIVYFGPDQEPVNPDGSLPRLFESMLLEMETNLEAIQASIDRTLAKAVLADMRLSTWSLWWLVPTPALRWWMKRQQ